MTKDKAFKEWSDGLWEALPSNETEVFRDHGLRLIISALYSAYRAGQEEMRAKAAIARPNARTIDELRTAIASLPLEGEDG